MIPTHCRHRTYPKPGASPFPTHCEKGVRYKDVQLPDRNVIDGSPCGAKGRANGATCEHYEPWTAEEIAENERQTQELLDALERGECVECGTKLVQVGARFGCPACGGTSGFNCRMPDWAG